jgi:hypothetical protein
LVRPGRPRQAWLATALLALAAGCSSSAPLAGKPCPCATEHGYTCCDASNMCVTEIAQCAAPPPPPCTSVKLMNLVIMHDGGPHSGDGGPDAIQFGSEPELWVSYPFEGEGQQVPTIELTPDGNGFRVMASIDLTASDQLNLYAGAGVSFLSPNCIDGSDLTGVQFEFAGDLGASQLFVGVVADEDVSTTTPDPRATCTGGKNKCFGPNHLVDATPGLHQVPFEILSGGMPVPKLSIGHIVDVQWQLPAVQIPHADFTISNVQFYR